MSDSTVASYLEDVAEELSPENLENYLVELESILPPKAVKHLRQAYHHQTKAKECVEKAGQEVKYASYHR